MSRTQWYIGAPNGVILCVDRYRGGEPEGVFYHSYSADPVEYHNVADLIFHMDALYDMLNFPHRGTNERSFTDAQAHTDQLTERTKVMSDDRLLQKHGDIGTFIVRVQHRQNSSWQGRITWMEEDKTIQFRSTWELMKLIESAVNTVSMPEEEEQEPTWFDNGE